MRRAGGGEGREGAEGAAAIKGKGRRRRQRRENFQYGEVNFTSADSRLRENTRGRKKHITEGIFNHRDKRREKLQYGGVAFNVPD